MGIDKITIWGILNPIILIDFFWFLFVLGASQTNRPKQRGREYGRKGTTMDEMENDDMD